MAGSSLLALLDDIATVLDDVAILSKVAAKKTAGVLGDDLALNAEQVSGIRAEREIPVVLAVAKGSLKNKLILVPSALLISAVLPWLIVPLLMLGGCYLCFEGFEKIWHHFFHSHEAKLHQEEIMEALTQPDVDLVEFEKEKIKGAIRTDFILSAEIIVIALGTVKDASFSVQAMVVSGIALLMTIGVYGLVAAIVKIDDVGLYLSKATSAGFFSGVKRTLGKILLGLAPRLMKALSVIGTLAMFLVGGGILVHGLHALESVISLVAYQASLLPWIGGFLSLIAPSLTTLLFGLLAGGLLLLLFNVFQTIRAHGKKTVIIEKENNR